MRAKVRPHNYTPGFRESIDREARAYFDERVDEYAKRLQAMLAKRWVAATLLAASDQHGFGAKRGKNLIDGIIEIMCGNCDDVYDKNEIDKPGTDKALMAMMRELEDRGIRLVVTADGAKLCAEITQKEKAR